MGKIVVCTTNRIEGAWKISKNHFRRINGTNTANFEQHVSEIIWRNHVHNENIYEKYLQLVSLIFRLDCEPQYTYLKPLLHSWTPPSKEDEAAHKVTIIQEIDSKEKASDEVPTSSLEPSAPGPSPGILLPENGMDDQSIKAVQRNTAHQDSDGESENGLAHSFFPQGFKPLKTSIAKKSDSQKCRLSRKRRSNHTC